MRLALDDSSAGNPTSLSSHPNSREREGPAAARTVSPVRRPAIVTHSRGARPSQRQSRQRRADRRAPERGSLENSNGCSVTENPAAREVARAIAPGLRLFGAAGKSCCRSEGCDDLARAAARQRRIGWRTRSAPSCASSRASSRSRFRARALRRGESSSMTGRIGANLLRATANRRRAPLSIPVEENLLAVDTSPSGSATLNRDVVDRCLVVECLVEMVDVADLGRSGIGFPAHAQDRSSQGEACPRCPSALRADRSCCQAISTSSPGRRVP